MSYSDREINSLQQYKKIYFILGKHVTVILSPQKVNRFIKAGFVQIPIKVGSLALTMRLFALSDPLGGVLWSF